LKRYTFVRTPDPIYVDTVDEADSWVARYLQVPAVGYDTETTGLHKIRARIKFFSMSDGLSRICAPVRLLEQFAPILEDEHIEKRMTNEKFDMHMSANHGILCRGLIRDSVPMDHLLDENRKGRHGLKDCAKDYLGLRMSPFKDVFGAVGAVDKEVEMVTRFHDILESGDAEAAADVLALVGKADGDEEVLKSVKKLSLSKQGGYVLDARKLLAQARIHEMAGRSRGTKSYVADYLGMLSGIEMPNKAAREPYAHLLEDHDLIIEAHEYLLQRLRKLLKIDMDPLSMLRLLVCDYASLDAWGSFSLEPVIGAHLDEVIMADDEDGQPITLLDFYNDTSCPFTKVLWNMERRGFGIDLAAAETHQRPMFKTIGRLEREFVSLVGHDVNLKSPQQLKAIFYGKDSNGDWIDPFGRPPTHWTKGGASGVKNPSTGKEVIKEWAEKGDKLATLLVEHRQLTKLHDTYLVNVPNWVDHRQRIHTDLKQHGTVTGRLSSGDPNLQNIPARGAWGKKLRQLFVPGVWGDCSPEWCMDELRDVPVPDLDPDQPMTLIVADYEQLEMRIMAHFSGDPTMIDAIWRGLDLHCRTAELAGGLDYDMLVAAKKADNPTPAEQALVDQRSGFKAVGFGLLYGIGAVKLGRQLGLPISETTDRRGRTWEKCPEASSLIDQYFEVYPQAYDFIRDTKTFCHNEQYVQTFTGRFRRLPDILSHYKGIAKMAERQSVNSIIQGTAADITNEAMLKCEYDHTLRKLGVRMLLQIHDELVFEVPNIPKYINAAKKRIKILMEDPFKMLVPIAVSMDQADSWGDAK
jgi:DNA polymerase-1